MEEIVVEVNECEALDAAFAAERVEETFLSRHRAMVFGVAASCVIAALGAVVAWEAHLDSRAEAAYSEAVSAVAAACTPVEVDAELVEAGKSLDDASLVEAVTAPGVVAPAAGEMPAGREALEAAARELMARAGECQAASMDMTAAVEALEEAVIAKRSAALTAARESAEADVDAWYAVIGQSQGKVTDEGVRHVAQSAVDALKEVTAIPVKADDWKAMTAAISRIAEAQVAAETAVKAVSDSQAAWTQAQQAQAAASYSSGESSSSAGNGGNASYSSGYSASQVSQDYSNGSSNGTGVSSSTGAGAGAAWSAPSTTVPDGYFDDPDGHKHYQIQPDANGSYTGAETPLW
ncbi:hypothetical protein [Schaalia hyovaginalis]|uniref:Colicin transporter n=1 Tax=Schaalia hyovaginalis TaxID=29316 RepID=A0A923E8L1_9ACTO|nr:hypothetical protein [Schaalia hyovaginalis]MBB6335459.1 hypothetical protein [Schaalia hyovaginalis]